MTVYQDNNPEQISNIDFHRNVFCLIPEAGDEIINTFLIEATDVGQKNRIFCSCSKSGSYAKCSHASKLNSFYELYTSENNNKSSYDLFLKDRIWTVFEPITRISSVSGQTVSYEISSSDDQTVTFFDNHRNFLLSYKSANGDRQRLIERLSPQVTPSRFNLMNKGLDFIRSDQERELLNKGFKTQRQTVEDSIWYRLAYHCFREAKNTFSIDYRIDTTSGHFILLVNVNTGLLQCHIPQKAVPGILDALQKINPDIIKNRVNVNEQELLFRIKVIDNKQIAVYPCISYDQNSTNEFYAIQKKFTYESFVYISNIDKLIKLDSTSLKLLATGWGEKRVIDRESVSEFIEKNETVFSIGTTENDTSDSTPDLFSESSADDYKRIVEPEMLTRFDRVELCPVKLDNDTCTISINYVKGKHAIPLSDITFAKKNKTRFIFSDEYLVDCCSPGIRSSYIASKGSQSDGTVTLSRAALLQFRGTSISTCFSGEEKLVKQIRKMLEFKSAAELKELTKYTGMLRGYQEKGVQWLLFLYDNTFGGLLCDDMGLGKTHQILAFIASVKEHRSSTGAILIVCPTTVVSHWIKVVDQFSPSLKMITYHNSDRLQLLDEKHDILLTTYGVLRNDQDILNKFHFNIAVFDEAQLLKNKETSTSFAAAAIKANVKIGLTGTPIENSMRDLKSLFNITLPGLLSNDEDDEDVLINAIDDNNLNTKAASHLQRLTAPFILRRLKQTVLDELPPKIEDRRTCSLSADQFSMYQTAIENRAKPLLETINNDSNPVPYMHIFSLLNYLKQVCNHPALTTEDPVKNYELYESEKWELFKELLEESIGSGQKVVVFSQYLGMIDIINAYLEKMSIGHVILTGKSKKRDEIIKKFATDDQCKIFVGSLKAGGVGIDLVAGSVVIHYDRWWNAAREDQATDRVHRIGQTRGVQVFKLVTEGTVEDTIDKIIERKKVLSSKVLVEDSPDVLKQFTREDLVELLSMR